MKIALVLLIAVAAAVPMGATSQSPVDVGVERQLFLDDFWFENKAGIELRLQTPVPREVSIRCERPWEKKAIHYSCVVYDQGRYRMWYRVDDGDPRTDARTDRTWACYAESKDGIVWEKPNLGITPYQGVSATNILAEGKELYNLSVIVDPKEKPGSARRYKAISRVGGITGLESADGIRWRPVENNPFHARSDGPFDSHNTLVWDDEGRRYVIYMRGIDSSVPGSFKGGRRAIRRSESADFKQWTKPELVVTADANDPSELHFYTNAAIKYERAARAFLMFPMILYPARHYPGAPNPGTSDVQFATSRDGRRWERAFRRPLLSPGLDERDWVDRNPIVGQGVVQTGPGEISVYYSELYRAPETRIRRATLRTDGFVAVEGRYTGGGEFTTRPIQFGGRRLELNYRTSGGGSMKVELQDAAGKPIPGFSLADCSEIFGDKIDGVIRWKGGDDLSSWSGKPVRLRVQLRDAELFAFRFARD